MKRIIRFNNMDEMHMFCGNADENLTTLESNLGLKISAKGQKLSIYIPDDINDEANKILDILVEQVGKGRLINKQDILCLIKEVFVDPNVLPKDVGEYVIYVGRRGSAGIVARTSGQREYVSAMRTKDLVFALGPAGTGKTYLAMAMAVEFLMKKKVQRIILTRPAVEAGEKLGFLPGSLEEKMNPYLRPLYDALYDMMDPEDIEEFIETGIIEVAPLAFMRGRTLNNAFIVLDEAQNCTPEQMKMFLTRFGFGSKVVVTGDLTQSDLIGGRPIGLLEAIDVLKDIDGIEFVYLTGLDVVRHELVQEIIKAYSQYQQRKTEPTE